MNMSPPRSTTGRLMANKPCIKPCVAHSECCCDGQPRLLVMTFSRLSFCAVSALALSLALGGTGQAQNTTQNSTQENPAAWLTRLFQPPAAVPVPGPGVSEGQWSGQSGASGDPRMTADAIRAAAADFPNCIAGLWPLAE